MKQTYLAVLDCDSSDAQVFPKVVMATPAMVTKTETTFAMFTVSCPRNAPMKRVNSPVVENNTVDVETFVLASVALARYCRKQNHINKYNWIHDSCLPQKNMNTV